MKNQDEINLINFFTHNKNLTRAQRERFASLVARDMDGFKPSNISNDMGNLQEFESERTKFNPLITADFLSLFGAPSGFKFLTHDFDPNSDMSMPRLLKQVNNIIKEWKDKIPESLHVLMTSFVQKGGWIDFKGDKHKLFLEGDNVKKWCSENPKLNPIISNEFGAEIQDFRNTVRLSQPELEGRLNDVIKSNDLLAELNIKTEKLNRADFYTNVLVLKKILRAILRDIAQRNQQANIKIELVREIYNNSYRTYIIRIKHIDSRANDFEEVKKKLYSKGGALYNIFESCIGYCDWSIEATFEDCPKRWNIINHTQHDEFQDIDTPDGFTHILTFFKKID